MSFLNDNNIPSAARFGKLISDIARASKGKLVAATVREHLGANVDGRSNKEIREAVTNMCLSFPKDETL